MDDFVKRARIFACDAHKDQKYGDKPYSYHLEAVATLAKPFGTMAEATAWLHDTVEDTGVTFDAIESEFGLLAREILYLLTDESGPNRKTRKALTNAKMAGVKVGTPEEVALIVKTCDRLANVRSAQDNNHSLFLMYQKEYVPFREACYRPGLCDTLWNELDLISPRLSLFTNNR